MLQTFKGKITWIDLLNPSLEELDYLKKNYQIHPLVLEELKLPSARSKAEKYNDYIFIVLHFPQWDPQCQTSRPFELDIILTKDYLITASYQEKVEMREELMEKIYAKDFEERYLNSTTLELFYFIVENFIEFAMREIAHINEKIDNISQKIFSGGEFKFIKEIALAKRDVLDFRRIYRLLKEILSSLTRLGPRVFGEDSRIYFDDLLGDSLKVENAIENFADTIEALEQTNNSLIENRINTLTRIYTILSFITWPTLLIISSFQMNAKYNPISGLPLDYFIMVAIALIPSLIFYFIIKRKKII